MLNGSVTVEIKPAQNNDIEEQDEEQEVVFDGSEFEQVDDSEPRPSGDVLLHPFVFAAERDGLRVEVYGRAEDRRIVYVERTEVMSEDTSILVQIAEDDLDFTPFIQQLQRESAEEAD